MLKLEKNNFGFSLYSKQPTEAARYHIYISQWPVINIKASFCAWNLRIKV